MVLQIGIIIALLLWKPTTDHIPVFFVISGLWGVCDGVWLVQINGNILYIFLYKYTFT